MNVDCGLTFFGMALLIYAAVHDLIVRTVPNWISVSITFLAVVARLHTGDLSLAILFSLGVFFVLSSLWYLNLFGGGDVKLWSAATLLVRPFWHNEWLVFSSIVIIGGLIALVYFLLYRVKTFRHLSFNCNRHSALWRRGLRSEIWRVRRGGPVPYAVAICAGFLIML